MSKPVPLHIVCSTHEWLQGTPSFITDIKLSTYQRVKEGSEGLDSG